MDIWQYITTTMIGGLVVYFGYFVKGYVDQKNKNKQDELTRDRKLYSDVMSILPPDSGSVYFLQNQDFWTSFSLDSIAPLKTIQNVYRTPDKFFYDKAIDTKYQSFVSSVDGFLNRLVELSIYVRGDFLTCVRADCNPDFDIPEEVENEIVTGSVKMTP